MERFSYFSNGDEQGGSEPKDDYEKKKEKTYCDKGGHKDRSIANSPKHKDHWKKEEKK